MYRLLLAALAATAAAAAPGCNDAETAEAKNAFKNCFESAQGGLVTRMTDETGRNAVMKTGVCDTLDEMAALCERETKQLAR